jgi:hypothetical protein
MRVSVAFGIAAVLASIGIAGAQEFKPPPMKDGFWETHSIESKQGKTLFETTVKMCQSKDIANSMQANADELRKKNGCTSTVSQPSANTYVEESRCSKGPNAGSVTKVIYTYQADVSSHTEMHVNAGADETVMIMDTKYVGSCPADVKPGDMVMSDGKKISASH